MAERVLRVGPDQRFASSLLDMGRRQAVCRNRSEAVVLGDPSHPELCLADAGCVRQSMVSNTGFSSPGELESFSGPRLESSTARRHGISASLLFTWRRTYRYGTFAVAPIV